ncbi:MAG: dual specificity protein phosphatase family protein [Candidatus Eiseniibacteriota bacterium]
MNTPVFCLKPPLSWIADDIGPARVKLYVGDQMAAADPELLVSHGITAVLNCAYDLDINYVGGAGARHAGTSAVPFGVAPFRVAKVGLIDGPGNHPSLLAAACHALEGLLHQEPSTAPHDEPIAFGNVLVHCRAGLSRSVTVAALYLHLKHTDRWPLYEDALNHVRLRRGFASTEYQFAPTQGMRKLAAALLASGQPMFKAA